MKCPHCGAHNPDTSQWCTQCLEPMGQPPVTEASQVPARAADEGLATQAPAAADDRAAADPAAGERMVRAGDEGVEWRCAQCGTWNTLGLVACTSCGNAFGREPSSASRRDPRLVGWLVGIAIAVVVVGVTLLLMLATG